VNRPGDFHRIDKRLEDVQFEGAPSTVKKTGPPRARVVRTRQFELGKACPRRPTSDHVFPMLGKPGEMDE
jgi:hypothetical protein